MRAVLCTIGLALLVGVELGAPTREPFETGTAPKPAIDTARCGPTGKEQNATLTKPADLLLLESPDRAIWQQPDQVMDRLNIALGSWVADVGAGSGWFTIRLAQRVDSLRQGDGKVFAQDVQQEMLTAIDRRVRREGLRNVETRRGDGISPNLPLRALDAILVVDVYSEVGAEDRVPFLRNLAASLKPHGRIGIVNHKLGAGGPGPCASDRVPRSVVEGDARQAALRILSNESMDLKYQYLVVLGK
jgi:SAM-dependent methyltransferase